MKTSSVQGLEKLLTKFMKMCCFLKRIHTDKNVKYWRLCEHLQQFNSIFCHMPHTHKLTPYVLIDSKIFWIWLPSENTYAVEQVPPPLVIGLGQIWDKKGQGMVSVPKNSDGCNKQCCIVNIILLTEGNQTNIEVIFREKYTIEQ